MNPSKFRLAYRIVLITLALFYSIATYPDGWSRFALLVAVIALFMTLEEVFMKKAGKTGHLVFIILFAFAFFITFYVVFLV